MTIDHQRPPSAYNNPMYTPIVSVSGARAVHFFAGRCAQDRDGRTVCLGDMVGQLRFIMNALTEELGTLGIGWNNVVFRRMFTVDMDACLRAEADDEVLGHFDAGKMPASTLVGVTRLANPDYLVEVELTAIAD